MKSPIPFLLVVLTLYGGMHLYVLLRLRKAFALGAAVTTVTAAVMVLFIFAPILVKVLENEGQKTVALATAFAGYTWMGFIFLLFSLLIAFDLVRWITLAAGVTPQFFTIHRAAILSLLLASILSAWGWYEARNVGVANITIETEKLSPGIDRFRIVQISDVHLGLMLGEERLEPIIRLIKEADPDLLVSTGDLVDGQMDSIAGSALLFREIEPPHGKLAVKGNHEFFAGVRISEAFHEKAGFRLLRGERESILDGAIVVAGVDDPAGKDISPLIMPRMFRHAGEEEAILSAVEKEAFRILLKHQPTVETGLFDLQLSGHTHKGQIAPFNLVVRLFYRYTSGLHSLPGGGHLYVSRGAGTWGPPMRVLSPPEVVVIDLVNPDGVKSLNLTLEKR